MKTLILYRKPTLQLIVTMLLTLGIQSIGFSQVSFELPKKT